jgi:hypothetical protein
MAFAERLKAQGKPSIVIVGSGYDQALPHHLRRAKARPNLQPQPPKKSGNHPLISTPYLTLKERKC